MCSLPTNSPNRTGFVIETERFDGVFAHRQTESGAPAVKYKSNRVAWQMLHLLFWAVGSSFNFPKI